MFYGTQATRSLCRLPLTYEELSIRHVVWNSGSFHLCRLPPTYHLRSCPLVVFYGTQATRHLGRLPLTYEGFSICTYGLQSIG